MATREELYKSMMALTREVAGYSTIECQRRLEELVLTQNLKEIPEGVVVLATMLAYDPHHCRQLGVDYLTIGREDVLKLNLFAMYWLQKDPTGSLFQ